MSIRFMSGPGSSWSPATSSSTCRPASGPRAALGCSRSATRTSGTRSRRSRTPCACCCCSPWPGDGHPARSGYGVLSRAEVTLEARVTRPPPLRSLHLDPVAGGQPGDGPDHRQAVIAASVEAAAPQPAGTVNREPSGRASISAPRPASPSTTPDDPIRLLGTELLRALAPPSHPPRNSRAGRPAAVRRSRPAHPPLPDSRSGERGAPHLQARYRLGAGFSDLAHRHRATLLVGAPAISTPIRAEDREQSDAVPVDAHITHLDARCPG